MRAGTVILLTAAVGLPVAGYAYYQYAIDKFGFYITGVNALDVSDGRITLRVTFAVQNETGLGFIIVGNQFNIYANGSLIGIAQQIQQVKVPNMTSATVYVDIVLDSSKLGSDLFKFLWSKISGNSADTQLEMQGTCQVKVDAPILNLITVNVPVDEKFSF